MDRELEHAAGRRDERGQPGRHRLEQRVAERLRGRREREDVGRRVGRRELRALQQAGDEHPGDLAPADLVLQGAPADEGQLRAAPLGGQRLPGLEQHAEILLPRDPPDVGHQQVIRAESECRAIGLAPVPG